MFNRFNGNVVPFASNATGTNRTVFGGTAQSDAIDDNLNADFKTGWEIVGVNDNPTKQDFNALAFTISNLVAYLYQQGVAVWNTTQEYFINSYVVGSDGKLYRSKTGTSETPNQDNDPISDSTNWESLDGKFVDLTTTQTIAGIKTFTLFPVTPSSAPTTDYEVANKKYVDDNLISGSFMGIDNFLHIQDRQTSGTDGGTFTSGSWVARVLNTVVSNTIDGASLSSNQITLPSGKYYIEASAPAQAVNSHATRLYDITNTLELITGGPAYCGTNGVAYTRSKLCGTIELTADTVIELQHRCQSTYSATGLGRAAGNTFTVNYEIYAELKAWKVG